MNASGIVIHHFPTGPFNWYVIEQSGRLTLCDAGFPGHYAVFEQGLRSLGRELRDVEAVLITHAHADHTGFADRVAAAARAPVYVHRDDAKASQRLLQLPWVSLFANAWRPYVAGMLGRAVQHGVFSASRVTKPRVVNDGEVLDVPGRPQVIHTPGHTAGEVAFYLPAANALISGDAIVTRDVYTGRNHQPQLIRPALNASHSRAMQSLERLRPLGHLTMYPGHGDPWTGEATDAVEHALAAARQERWLSRRQET